MNDIAPRLLPLLNVRNGAAAVAFYRDAFGLEERFRVEDPSGAIVATLGLGSMEFWIADESPEHGNPGPETLGGASARMLLVVADPDAAFARTLAAGATEVWPVEEQLGWRTGRLRDPFGHHWEITRPPQG